MPSQHDTAESTANRCFPQRPCGRFRTCPRCAKLRQRDAATLAEKLEKLFGPLALTVITPEMQQPEQLAKLRARFMELSKAPAGVWSIETGDQRGTLHTNLIHPLARPVRLRGAAVHTSTVRTSARAIGAYIVKPSQIPDPNLYPGRTFGRCGPLMSYLAQDAENPMIQAAALNKLLEIAPPPKAPPMMYNTPKPVGELSPEQYHQIALRHLPNLAALALALKNGGPLPSL